ncbi:MAG: hypothetical protein JST40_07720 [Armatimonadetes bacterium]|nr:hypothetical protein [Armatimonadota bacterium]
MNPTDNQLNAALEELHRLGVPRINTELRETQELAPELNGATDLKAITSTDLRAWVVHPACRVQNTSDFLKFNAVLEAVRRSLTKSEIRFSDPNFGRTHINFESAVDSKGIVRCLAKGGIYLTKRKRTAEAVEVFDVALKFVEAAIPRERWMGQLVTVTVHAILCKHLVWAISLDRTGTLARGISKILEADIASPLFGQVAPQDAFVTTIALRSLDENGGVEGLLKLQKTPHWQVGRNQVYLSDGLPTDPISRKLMLIELMRCARRIRDFSSISVLDKAFLESYAPPEEARGDKLLMEVLDDRDHVRSIQQAITFDIVRRKVTRAVAHLGVFRSAHGTFPTSLEECGAFYTDDIGGGPLRYEHGRHWAKVFTVLPDPMNVNGKWIQPRRIVGELRHPLMNLLPWT